MSLRARLAAVSRPALLVWLPVLATALLFPCFLQAPSLGLVIPICAGVCAFAGFQRRVDDYLACHGRQRVLLCGLWCALVSLGLLHANLRATWGLFDDHELMSILGPRQRLSLGEMASGLATHPEFGSPSPSGMFRFRPAYYGCRYAECCLWGARPALWYGTRLVLFALSLGLAWSLLWRRIGSLVAWLFMLLCLTYSLWGDIWCRLGPAETYAVFGTALYLHGVGSVWRTTAAGAAGARSECVLPWLSIAFGAILAMGSKENFLFLLPCTWLLGAWFGLRRQLDMIGSASVVVVTCVGLWIGVVLFLMLRAHPTDIYGQDMGVSHRCRLILAGCQAFQRQPGAGGLACAALMVGGLAAVAWRKSRSPDVASVLVRAGAVLLMLFAVFVAQYVFYNGYQFFQLRYFFPGDLMLPFAVAVLLGTADRLFRVGRLPGLPLWTAGVATVLAAAILARGFGPIKYTALENSRQTRRFSTMFDRVVTALNEDPSRPLLIVSHDSRDYEPICSLLRFLRSRQVENPLFLRTEGYRAAEQLGRKRSLAFAIEGWCHGAALPGGCPLQPISQLAPDAHPLGIGFHGPAGTETESLGCLWPLR